MTHQNILVFLLIVTFTYYGMFFPMLTGEDINSYAFYLSILLNGWLFRFLWTQRGRKGWHGSLIGVAFGILVYFVAALSSSFV